MLRTLHLLLAPLLLAFLALPAAAQTIRFGTTTANPGEVVTLEVWYEAGGDAVGFDFIGRFEPELQIVAFRQGGHRDTSCNVIAADNELRIFGVDFTLLPLPDHRACSVDLRVDPEASPGWHGLLFDADEPRFNFVDADANPLAGHLHGGGVYVVEPDRSGTCTLLHHDAPDPDFVPAFAPVCACLRSGDFPLHRCGIRIPGMFELWREFPSTPDPWKWDKVNWTLIPLRDGLPQLAVDSWSESGKLWTKPVYFKKGAKPLQARGMTVPIKAEGTKPLESLQVVIKMDGHAWQFEQRWSGVPEE